MLPIDCARQYTKARYLDSGGYADVYLATQQSLSRQVAVKVLRPHHRQNIIELERFREEARLTAALRHPHIAIVMDCGFAADAPWIAFEYLPRTVASLMSDAPLAWPVALQVARQVASALDHVHTSGYLHRDVKPANVLQAGPGTFKLTDFGIAIASPTAPQMLSQTVLGTPEYLAPERFIGADGPKADLYALGVMLFLMLTGRLPYRAVDAVTLGRSHAFAPIPRPSALKPGLPAHLDGLIQTAMAKHPDDRFDSAAAFGRALDQLLAARAQSWPVHCNRARPRSRAVPGTVFGSPVRSAGGVSSWTRSTKSSRRKLKANQPLPVGAC